MKDLDPWDFPLKENEIREQLKAVKPLLFEKRLQMFEQYVSVLNFKMDALNTACAAALIGNYFYQMSYL